MNDDSKTSTPVPDRKPSNPQPSDGKKGYRPPPPPPPPEPPKKDNK